jgi:hypothetical protein
MKNKTSCRNNFFKKNRKAAMEMSVGTIVTIVLLMSVLVLGIFLVQKVFSSGTNAVDQIDQQVQNEINKLFSEEGVTLAIFPSSRQIPIKQGENKGFAFSVFNKESNGYDYTWTIEAQDSDSFKYSEKCGSGMTKEKAESYLVVSGGSFGLGGSAQMEIPELVLFDIPEEAPLCTIPYRLETERDNEPSRGTTVFIEIK